MALHHRTRPADRTDPAAALPHAGPGPDDRRPAGRRHPHHGRSRHAPIPALRLLLILSHAAALLTVAALFLELFGDLAVQRGRPAGGWVDLLVGAPRGIDARRLLIFAVVLTGLLITTAGGLHGLIRDGGWLRERIDRLRAPAIRGALGSSHFCTRASTAASAAPIPTG
ncbi:MAG: hypothetical protein IPK19_41815 [Chloroflexi bacterium]|nr:hypothetical protein [Chloroflexota bacterium]